MIFDSYDCADAEGVLLAHTLRIPGGTFKKGRVLTASDLSTLVSSGVETVFAAKLGPHDVPEDEAAAAVAKILGRPPKRARKDSARCSINAGAASLRTSDTVEPPKPPPVMRDPIRPRSKPNS